MAIQFYVEQSNSSYHSALASAEVHAGEIATDSGGLADATTAASDILGLALYSEEYMVGEDEDDVVDEVYAVDERIKAAPLEDTLRGYGRTPEDEGGTAPSIDHNTVVGLIDTSVGDAPGGAAGRLVEEGYTNGATTFNRTNDNFVALGEAYRPGNEMNDTVTEFDTVVRVNFYGEVKQ